MAKLYFATVLAGVGSGVTLISVTWILLELYESSVLISSLSVISYLAVIILLPRYGKLLDKSNKKNTLTKTYIIASFALIMFFFISFFTPELIALSLSSILATIIRSADQLGRTSIAKHLVAAEDYLSINKHLEVVRQSITFLSGGVSVILLEHLEPNLLIAINGITFFAAALMLAQIDYIENIQPKELVVERTTRASARGEKSFDFFKSHPMITILLLLSIIPYVLVVSQNVIYPAHFKDFLQIDAGFYAMLSIPYGLGAMLPAMTVRKGKYEIANVVSIYTTIALFAYLTITYFKLVYATYACLFLFAYCHTTIRIHRNTWMMEVIDPSIFARINSIFESIAILQIIVCSFFFGIIIDAYGVQASWLLCITYIGVSLLGTLAASVYSKISKTNGLNSKIVRTEGFSGNIK